MNVYKTIWDFRKLWLNWIILSSVAYFLIYFEIGYGAGTLILIIFGLWTKTFYQTLTFLGLFPGIGLYIYRILTIPLFWLLNGLGFRMYNLFSGRRS
ncbi:MAG: hypothetical protein IIC40_00865 [Candidatus Marinimicrobia bacterium]|nr:hypothetical protein [Candidatus Neomarinimicrobiota bacterium]